MRSSILIAFLVVAISSSTYGVDNIFGVEINPNELYTLNPEQVKTEIQAKLDLANQIVEIAQKVPTNERGWLNDFKKMVTDERDIMEKLQVQLSHLNTDGLDNINDENLKSHISNEAFANLKKGLADYMRMLKTFDFSQTVWEDRSFLGNPFEEFLGKIKGANPEGLKAKTLKEAFKKAATDVGKAKNAISATMASFTKRLNSQNKKSELVMVELRILNLLAVPQTPQKVKKSVNSLTSKLKRLQSAIENVNNIPALLQCFMDKRAWLDEVRTQLINIDNVHKKLNNELARI